MLSVSAPLVTVIALMVVVILASLLQKMIRPDNSKTLYGNARFAKLKDCKKAGLLDGQGILLGRFKGRYLNVPGHEHMVVFSPSGSGKSSALAIPNLLTLNDSMVVNDVKFELFELTSGYRAAHGQACYLWAPSRIDGKTHAYNPLDFVPRNKHYRVKYLQKIARTLIPDNPHSDPIWVASPRKLMVALALYLMDTPGACVSLGEINRTLKQPKFLEWLEATLTEREDLDPLFYQDMHQLLALDSRTRSNIIESFSVYFNLFDDPLIDAATSHSDFDVRQLRKEKMTIYVGFSPDDMRRLAPLLTMFWEQVIDAMIAKQPKGGEPHSVVLLIDEFASLNRMDALKQAMGLLRSYHVRVVIFLQNLAQVISRYGKEDATAFMDAKIKASFGVSDVFDAEFMSKQLGNCTVKVRNKSVSGGINAQRSVNIQSQARALMLPQEIMALEDKLLVKIHQAQAVKVSLISWYQENCLKNRVLNRADVKALGFTSVVAP